MTVANPRNRVRGINGNGLVRKRFGWKEACEMENLPMIRMMVVVGSLLFGAGAGMAQQTIAVQQDNLMRAQGKSMYVTMLKMVKGEMPYDQVAIDAAVKELEEDVPKIATVFEPNPKEQVVNAT